MVTSALGVTIGMVTHGPGATMLSHGSVTQLICEIKTGEGNAAQKLWEAYFRKLVRLARNKLGKTPRRAADEEDVALSAFDSFFAGVAKGRFPQLNDRTD